MSDDPDPETRGELSDLLERQDSAGLNDRFAARLRFGTAGLRGVLGAGPNRMNRKVVLDVTAGLCRVLLREVPGAKERGICVGYDGRAKSQTLAQDVCRVAAGYGFIVHAFEHVVPTPLLNYACLAQRAAAGVMVTASHNPPEYNGYKVFWSDGAQIMPPYDEAVCAAAAEVRGERPAMPLEQARAAGRFVPIGPDSVDRYLEAIRALQVHPGLPRNITIAYTALHGVGEEVSRRAFRECGYRRVFSVAAQAKPDPEFSTVRFPNPEEEGAMDRVLALAAEQKADLVLAHDPDADRLAVAVRTAEDEYRRLSGNEVGCLLAHYLLDQGPAGSERFVVSTVVSSPMLGAIAEAHGVHWAQTLTGFKWIIRSALSGESEGMRFVLGYEEALGYAVGRVVRDKDGIGAALVVADMAAWCRSRGQTLVDLLHALYLRYGLFASRQVSVRYEGAGSAASIEAVMRRARAPERRRVGPFWVVERFDHRDADPELRADLVRFVLRADGAAAERDIRLVLRPSGTEPKVKAYINLCIPCGGDLPAAEAQASASLDAVEAALREAFLGA